MAQGATMTILDPVVEPPKDTGKLAPLLGDVRGKSVGFRVMWRSFGLFMERIDTLLRERYDVPKVLRVEVDRQVGGKAAGMHATKEQLDSLAKESDFVILGLAG